MPNGYPKTGLRSMAMPLAVANPPLAAEWDYANNGDRTPENTSAGSHYEAGWMCPRCKVSWRAAVRERGRNGRNCRCLRSIAATRPDLLAQWFVEKNAALGLFADHVTPCSGRVTPFWRCLNPKTPECLEGWRERPLTRTKPDGTLSKCRHCNPNAKGLNGTVASKFPAFTKWWDESNTLSPHEVLVGSGRRVGWKCPACAYGWQAVVRDFLEPMVRGGRAPESKQCPACAGDVVTASNNLKVRAPKLANEWSAKNKLSADKVFAHSIEIALWDCSRCGVEFENTPGNRMASTRARLEGGCPTCNKKGWTLEKLGRFVESLRPHLGSLTPAELFVLFKHGGMSGTAHGIAFLSQLSKGASIADALAAIGLVRSPSIGAPVVMAGSAVSALRAVQRIGSLLSDSAEAAEFFIQSKLNEVWRSVFRRGRSEAKAVRDFQEGNDYSNRVKKAFLSEYNKASLLKLPRGYAFTIEGRPVEPNLMQKLLAIRVKAQKRVGNWSGAGAGKTLSAILASRVCGASFTLITCPNNVISTWVKEIRAAFSDSRVCTKTFEPDWAKGSGPRYLVLNYEMFQQMDSDERMRAFIAHRHPDMIVIDEIHYAKHREADQESSKRRRLIGELVETVAARNEDIRVLGMSSTPVINNLYEGKSLAELIQGKPLEIETTSTIANCMSLHVALTRLGIRWLPDYRGSMREIKPRVDCAEFLDDIRACKTTLELEQLLTKVKLPAILRHIKPKTLIYTHYITGIGQILETALEAKGWKVGFFTGEDKTGLEGFLHGDVDVLIGTSAIGTGVDGLQTVCKSLIFNALPWTSAEFDQIRGRIYRQGQKSDVTVVIPRTFAVINGKKWSWCDARCRRIKFKQSLADSSVDGVIPTGKLRTPKQAFEDLMAWRRRLEDAAVSVGAEQ